MNREHSEKPEAPGASADNDITGAHARPSMLAAAEASLGSAALRSRVLQRLRSRGPDPAAAPPATATAQPAPASAGPSAETAPGAGDLTLQHGALTLLGEGRNAFIHWPGTPTSGVTLGNGYDIGSRTEQEVVNQLIAAGMGEAQAQEAAKGAGLKGEAAHQFVVAHRDAVGEIGPEVRQKLLGTLLDRYEGVAKQGATSTKADGNGVNAASREANDGVAAGTYVMSEAEWGNLHPAMVEFLTDLKYQGGYYGYDRIAKINTALKANDGNALEQFKAVRVLFENGYMDQYAGRLGEGKGRAGVSETFFDQRVDMEGKFRRNQIRLAYLNKVIAALEAGGAVRIGRDGDKPGGATAASGATPAAPTAAAPTAATPSAATTPAASTPAAPGPAHAGPAGAQHHVVEPGESLIRLARRFNVSVDALKSANAGKLKHWGAIEGFWAHDTIVIPSAAAAAPQPQASQASQPSPGGPGASPASTLDTSAVVGAIAGAAAGPAARETVVSPALAVLLGKERLDAAEIDQARQHIAALPDDERGASYLTLQSKAQYHNQRDNQTPLEESSGGTCQLASLAMCLEYLGVKNPKPELQFDQALVAIAVEKKLADRLIYASTWRVVAEACGVNMDTLVFQGADIKLSRSYWETTVRDGHLAAGRSVLCSIVGHIVRIQAVTESGIVVDDPYGATKLGKGTKNDFSGKMNAGKNGWRAGNRENEGEDHAWPWEAVEQHVFRALYSFSK